VQRRLHERKEQNEEIQKRKLAMQEFLCSVYPLSLSLPLGLPHRRSRSVFVEELFLFVAQALISFVENFRHFSKKIGKKKEPCLKFTV
jgi:hypothetical protein